MDNLIIIATIGVLAIFGIKYTVKHFRGEGGCCGGPSCKVKKKRLKNISVTKTLIVEGMSCEHCKNAVERALNNLEGVAAEVNLKKKKVTVKMENDIPAEKLHEVIKKAGYEVVEIR